MMGLLILGMTNIVESIIARMSLVISHEFISVALNHIEATQKEDWRSLIA